MIHKLSLQQMIMVIGDKLVVNKGNISSANVNLVTTDTRTN